MCALNSVRQLELLILFPTKIISNDHKEEKLNILFLLPLKFYIQSLS